MIKTSLLILSISLTFWLIELLALVTVRMYQVRTEYWNWFNRRVSWERKRIIALVLGFWFLLGYMILQISDDILARDAAPYVLGGVFGTLMILWWLFQSVFIRWRNRIWLISILTGLGIGIGAAFFYDFPVGLI